jgi:hypothetical protein
MRALRSKCQIVEFVVTRLLNSAATPLFWEVLAPQDNKTQAKKLAIMVRDILESTIESLFAGT